MLLDNGKLAGLILLPMLSVSAACSVAVESKNASKACSQLETFKDIGPSLVLVGTDVVDKNALTLASIDLNHSYSTEIGGATLSLSIVASSNQLSITRVFQEPGEAQVTTTFYPVCLKNSLIIADGLRAHITDQGLLVWEHKTKVEGIPSDLWILYTKDE